MTASGPSDSTIATVDGVVHGGQSPIQGATVNLYVTSAAATGYGQAATLIGTGSTDATGSFTIAPSATSTNCPASQQAYITSAGGFPSGLPALANNGTLLVAALGSCVNIGSSTSVVINEVTTVAAAYALSGFTTTSASGAAFQANVSAPAANNAATGSSTAAAGLAHAFLNAGSLANFSSGAPSAQTANITSGAFTVNGTVPAVEINTLGNILAGCVNGATGNSACTKLFSFTPSISGAAPNNTLQAMIDLARNPYPTAAAMNASTGLFSLAGAVVPFQPQLAAPPPDWSLAIVYTSATAFPPLYDIALDANDTVYGGQNAATESAPALVGISAYGVPTTTFQGSSVTTRQIAPDALGTIWVSQGPDEFLTGFQVSSGAPLYTFAYAPGSITGVAVDKANNVWLSNAVTANPSIYQYKYGTGGYTPETYTAEPAGGFAPASLTIDANQNIWIAAYTTNGTRADVLANLTPGSTPSYTTSGKSITPVSATFASSASGPLGLAVDASGDAWYGITGSNSVTTTGIEEVVPVLTSSVLTGLSPQTLIANATLGAKASQIPAIDGAGTLYLADNQGSGTLGIHVYSTVAVAGSNTGGQVLSPPGGYLGCYLATASTTACATGTSSAVYNPNNVEVDSTGSVWAPIASGGFTQLVGLGAPTWPLLATGKPGVSPGNSAATPLP